MSDFNTLVFFLAAMVFTSAIAFYNGFFKLNENTKIDVKFSYLFFVFFIYLGVNLIGGYFLTSIFQKYFSEENIYKFYYVLNFLLSITVLILLIVYFYKINIKIVYEIIKKKTSTPQKKSYDIFIGIASYLIAYPIVGFFSSLVDILLTKVFKITFLPNQLAVEFIKKALSNPFNLIMGFVSVVILAPILEEFMFRGILYNFFKRFLNRFFSIILTSLIFAFFHFNNFQGYANITIITALFFFSLFLNFLYEKQKSLISCISLHATFNLITTIQLILSKGN